MKKPPGENSKKVDEEIIEDMMMNENSDAKQWSFSMMDKLDHRSFTTLLIVMWAIWTARRNAIHEGIYQSPIGTYDDMTSLKDFLGDLGEVFPTKMSKYTRVIKKSKARWMRLSVGMVKINVRFASVRPPSPNSSQT
jgi:hypothetical protein